MKSPNHSIKQMANDCTFYFCKYYKYRTSGTVGFYTNHPSSYHTFHHNKSSHPDGSGTMDVANTSSLAEVEEISSIVGDEDHVLCLERFLSVTNYTDGMEVVMKLVVGDEGDVELGSNTNYDGFYFLSLMIPDAFRTYRLDPLLGHVDFLGGGRHGFPG